MSTTSAPIDLSDCKILLIEDERLIRDIVVRMLSSIGVSDVTEASSAEAGWNYLVGEKQRHFHLVITDLTLPGASGSTFIKRLRALPSAAAKALPIIVLTGSTDLATYNKVAGFGISSYLMKPVSRDILRAAIEKAMSPAAPSASAAR